MMMNLAVALVAVAIPFVSAAPTAVVERACDATEFSSGYYLTGNNSFVQVSASLKADLGQTLTATVVDIATCTPYTGTDVALQTLTGSAFDRDFIYLPEQGIPSAGNTVTSNTVSWVAAVPNGSKNLEISVTARFGPGSLDNWHYAFDKLGVKYTAA